MGTRTDGYQDTWVPGQMGDRTYGDQDIWVSGQMGTRTYGCLDRWVPGQMGIRTYGYQDIWVPRTYGDYYKQDIWVFFVIKALCSMLEQGAIVPLPTSHISPFENARRRGQ